MKKITLLITSCLLAFQVQANLANDEGIQKLENELIELLKTKNLSDKKSQEFLKRNAFSLDDVEWKKNGNVIHGPFHLASGQEELIGAIPYVFAFNQGQKIVGVGGHLKPELVRKLKRLPTVTCNQTKLKNAQIEYYSTCYHQSSVKPQTVQQFKKAFTYLIYHSN